VEHGEPPARRLRLGDERRGLARAGRERLVDDHRGPPGERLARQGHVRAVRRGDHHEVGGRGPQGVEVRDDLRRRVRRARARLARRVARDDRGELESVGGRDERRVEDGAGHAVADQPHPPDALRPCRHRATLRRPGAQTPLAPPIG
jgi:hypothetical protein